MRTLMILCVLLPSMAACTTMDSTKMVIYEEGSINMNPSPYPVRAIQTEAGDTRYEYVMPDGSSMAIEDMGVYGNFTLTTMQNDGVDQTTDVKTDAKIDAKVPLAGGQ